MEFYILRMTFFSYINMRKTHPTTLTKIDVHGSSFKLRRGWVSINLAFCSSPSTSIGVTSPKLLNRYRCQYFKLNIMISVS